MNSWAKIPSLKGALWFNYFSIKYKKVEMNPANVDPAYAKSLLEINSRFKCKDDLYRFLQNYKVSAAPPGAFCR